MDLNATLEKRFPGRGGKSRAVQALHRVLQRRHPTTAGEIQVHSLNTRLLDLRKGDATWWKRPAHRGVLESLAELLECDPDDLVTPLGAVATGIPIAEFPRLPPLAPGQEPCWLSDRGWLLDEALNHLELSTPQWLDVPTGWGKSLAVAVARERHSDELQACRVVTLAEVIELDLRLPALVEIEIASSDDRRVWQELSRQKDLRLVVMAPFACPGHEHIVPVLGDWRPSNRWRRRLLEWTVQHAARSDLALDSDAVIRWLSNDPMSRFVTSPGDLLALCADIEQHQSHAKSGARARRWVRKVAPNSIPADAPSTWRETRIPELFQAAASERLRSTRLPFDEGPSVEVWDSLVSSRDKPPSGADGEGMVVEYLRRGGLLRGYEGGLDLYPRWVVAALQVAELDKQEGNVDVWGLISADVSRQPVVDAWLDSMPDRKLETLTAVVLDAGEHETLAWVAAIDAVFAAVGRRSFARTPEIDLGLVHRLVLSQLEILSPLHERSDHLVPITRRDHDEWVASSWAISLRWSCPRFYEPTSFERYLPAWTDEFSISELRDDFLPHASESTDRPAAWRVAVLGLEMMRGEPEAPVNIPMILVPGYVMIAAEREWPITGEHVRAVRRPWGERALTKMLSGSESQATVLTRLWSATLEAVPPDSRSLLGAIQYWSEARLLAHAVLARVDPGAAANMVGDHGLFDGHHSSGIELLHRLRPESRHAALEAWIRRLDSDATASWVQARAVADLLGPEDVDLVARLLVAVPYGISMDALASAIWRLAPSVASRRAGEALARGEGDATGWFVNAPRGQIAPLLETVDQLEAWPPWLARCLERWIAHGGEVGATAFRLLRGRDDATV